MDAFATLTISDFQLLTKNLSLLNWQPRKRV